MPRTRLKRETAQALLKALGVDSHPVHLTVLATVLDGLSPEAKADLAQFLVEPVTAKQDALAAVAKLEGYLGLPPFYDNCLDTIKKALTGPT